MAIEEWVVDSGPYPYLGSGQWAVAGGQWQVGRDMWQVGSDMWQ